MFLVAISERNKAMPMKASLPKCKSGTMIPPLPSPPITAFVFFMASTTLTSPTALAAYWPPFNKVISLKALVEERLDTVFPFLRDNT